MLLAFILFIGALAAFQFGQVIIGGLLIVGALLVVEH